MIAHAWTTLCDRCVVDRETDALRLETLESLTVHPPDDGAPAVGSCRFDAVSLWYRRDPDQGGQRRAQVCVLSPQLVPLARITVDVDLRIAQRIRTRCVIDGLVVAQPGTYFVTVDLWMPRPREVSRVPLQIELAQGRRPRRLDHCQLTLMSQFTSRSLPCD
jgi:hypothetical protein